MGSLLNVGRPLLKKTEKVLFELNNQYFNGTVNSVIDTGIKLWDGNHNKFRIEIVFDKITSSYNTKETLFAVKPDVSPYSGIRVRADTYPKSSDFVFTLSDECQVLNNDGDFSTGSNTYGFHVALVTSDDPHTVIITRDNDLLSVNLDSNIVDLEITQPKTNDKNLLIGCDYKKASGTQRYYKGTVYKFKIVET